MRFASALKISGPIAVAGHDIGGAVAQHLLAHDLLEVPRLALVNSVLYDSWPAPHVARFRDPVVAAATTADELLAARRQAVTAALAGAATEQLITDYLDPWTDPRIRRSWLAMAGAAESRYTLDLVPALQRSTFPRRTPPARSPAPSSTSSRRRDEWMSEDWSANGMNTERALWTAFPTGRGNPVPLRPGQVCR